MRILILEDDSFRINTFIEKFRYHELSITEKAGAAIEYLEKNEFDYIFLDHDLGTNNGNGTDVAEYLRDNPENLNNKAKIIIHSWNTPATEGMMSRLYNAVHIPFNTDSFFTLDLDK